LCGVQGESQSGAFFGREGTYWYAPQIGAVVKLEERLFGFETSGTVTETLTATSVPL
jgi:hypothetical protein